MEGAGLGYAERRPIITGQLVFAGALVGWLVAVELCEDIGSGEGGRWVCGVDGDRYLGGVGRDGVVEPGVAEEFLDGCGVCGEGDGTDGWVSALLGESSEVTQGALLGVVVCSWGGLWR